MISVLGRVAQFDLLGHSLILKLSRFGTCNFNGVFNDTKVLDVDLLQFIVREIKKEQSNLPGIKYEEFLGESNENPEQFILLEQVFWTPLKY